MDANKLIESQRIPLGRKPDPVKTGRLAEARRLTTLMSSSRGFSFVRLGDKDVAFLLYPDAVVSAFGDAPNQVTGTRADGTPGLQTNQTSRLRTALEKASYVDFWECQWKDDSWLEQLKLNRPANGFQNPNRETSCILGTWLEYEFKNYCVGRRVLFCGAEAPLLESLLRHEAFRECSGGFWPSDCQAFFLRPRNDGKNVGANLDLIKDDLREAVSKHKIDTLFVSLGGAAKILCQELADELKICAFDFGVGMRSLTYSGSGGYMAARGTHLIFLNRVPFGLYMDALVKTFPDLTPEALLAKAHAQLLLEVQEKEVGWSHSAWEDDFSPENVAHFREGFREYKRRYRHLFNHSAITRKERADFLHFCGTHKLTWEGRLFMAKFHAKGIVRRCLGRSS
jgi:hypothetical protein